ICHSIICIEALIAHKEVGRWAVYALGASHVGRLLQPAHRRAGRAPSSLTRRGRVETANYRTVKLPSDIDEPLFVKRDFGAFYKAVFDRVAERYSMGPSRSNRRPMAEPSEYSWTGAVLVAELKALPEFRARRDPRNVGRASVAAVHSTCVAASK